MALQGEEKTALDEALGRQGMRSTRHREHVFNMLLDRRDHPTADEVYARAKETMPTISLATVYNCLETLVECELVRQVNYEREPTRYCPNLAEHAHFHDKATGRIFDVDVPESFMDELKKILPEGYHAENIELLYHGTAEDLDNSDSIEK